MTIFSSIYQGLLLDILRMRTVTPLETGQPSSISEAQEFLRAFLDMRGFRRIFYDAGNRGDIDGAPLIVKQRADEMGETFFECQPSAVFSIGGDQPHARTLMFNFHLDTVSGEVSISFDGRQFHGRGAVDSKGPGVALLAGIASAYEENPELFDTVRVLIQCVSGEEGGAMGYYGTRRLIQRGYFGRLNIFAEPSSHRFMDVATASMTLQLSVVGDGVTDDAPAQGDNATLILSFFATYLARALAPKVDELGAKLCLAGLHTGYDHNRVYGGGQLKFNFAYASTADGVIIKHLANEAIEKARHDFQREYSDTPFFGRTSERLPLTLRADWLKSDLPVLRNRDRDVESLLVSQVGVARIDDDTCAFTSDAIWGALPASYSIVFGPGDLGTNGAHTEREYIDLMDLERYACSVKLLVKEFAQFLCGSTGQNDRHVFAEGREL